MASGRRTAGTDNLTDAYIALTGLKPATPAAAE